MPPGECLGRGFLFSLSAVLLGQDKDQRYQRLTLEDRRNVLRILQAIKKGLPEYLLTASL